MFIGEISALTAAFLWSNSSIIFTSASIRIGSVQLNVDRMLLASLYLIITVLIFKIDFNLSSMQIFLLTISGFIGLIIGDTAIFKSFSEIGPRFTMLFYSINPAIASVFSFLFLDEKLELFDIIGMIITLSGIALVALDKKQASDARFKLSAKGIFYGTLSAFGQGIGLVFAKMAYTHGEVHSITATLVRISTSVVLLMVIASILKRYKNPVKLYLKDRKSLGLVTIGSIIGPFLGITLSFIALENTEVGIAATLMSTTPILILPLSIYFYKEKIHFKSILGAFIAVAGIALLFLS